jgi:uncharacterized Zn finger protein
MTGDKEIKADCPDCGTKESITIRKVSNLEGTKTTVSKCSKCGAEYQINQLIRIYRGTV